MKNTWNWQPPADTGVWRQGVLWARPFLAATPWLSLGIVLLLFAWLAGTFTRTSAIAFDLPTGTLNDADVPLTTIIMMPSPSQATTGPLLYFEDMRYLVSDAASMASFRRDVEHRLSRVERQDILLLADKRLPLSDVTDLVGKLRAAGVTRVSIAERKP